MAVALFSLKARKPKITIGARLDLHFDAPSGGKKRDLLTWRATRGPLYFSKQGPKGKPRANQHCHEGFVSSAVLLSLGTLTTRSTLRFPNSFIPAWHRRRQGLFLEAAFSQGAHVEIPASSRARAGLVHVVPTIVEKVGARNQTLQMGPCMPPELEPFGRHL